MTKQKEDCWLLTFCVILPGKWK